MNKKEKFKKLGLISQEESIERRYGKKRTPIRDAYEQELKKELINIRKKK